MSEKIKVKGKVQNFNLKEKKQIVKQSNFFLTINTNQRYKDEDEYLGDDTAFFQATIEKLLQNLDKYLIFPNGDNFDNVENVDVNYIVEKGLQKNCLHSHILIKVNHHTNVKLDFKKIKAFICEELGLPNIHLLNRMSRDNNKNILEYLDKYQKQK